MAARRPEPPAPITMTSYWWRSKAPGPEVSGVVAVISEEPRVVEGTGGDQQHVEVGDRHREQGEPGVGGVALVELRHPRPELVAHRVLAEVPQTSTGDVTARVA